MLKISQLDLTWTLPSRMDDHPMAWLIEVNGFIIDIRGMHHMISKLKPLMLVLYLISQVTKSIEIPFCVTAKVP